MMSMDGDMNKYFKTASEPPKEILETCQVAAMVVGGHSLLCTHYAIKAIDDFKK